MKDINKILLPVDFSEASPPLLQYGLYYAKKLKAKLFILFVAEDPYTYTGLPAQTQFDSYGEGLVEHSRKRMESFLHENLGQGDVDYESEVLSGHPAEEIISYCSEKDIDLIIIGTHGYRGLDRMLFGSVAEKVVKMAPCPVLTINTYEEKA